MVCVLSGVDFLYRYAGTAGHTKTPSPVRDGGNPVVPLCLTRRFPADVRSSATIRQGTAGRIPYNGGGPSFLYRLLAGFSQPLAGERTARRLPCFTHPRFSVKAACLFVPGLCVSNSAIVTRNGSVVKSFLKKRPDTPASFTHTRHRPASRSTGGDFHHFLPSNPKKPDFFSYGSTVMLFSS